MPAGINISHVVRGAGKNSNIETIPGKGPVDKIARKKNIIRVFIIYPVAENSLKISCSPRLRLDSLYISFIEDV
jgi:hypothetical protein